MTLKYSNGDISPPVLKTKNRTWHKALALQTRGYGPLLGNPSAQKNVELLKTPRVKK